MTCIVGLVDNSSVYMGSDSHSVANVGSWAHKVSDGKVFSNGEFLIGTCGDFRFPQILKHCVTFPEIPEGKSITSYMCNEFTNCIRTTLKASGYTEVNNNVETGGLGLIGVRGKLFMLERNFSVIEFQESYLSIGSGAHFAAGSLYETPKLGPMERISRALAAAAHLDAYVAPPFSIFKLSNKETKHVATFSSYLVA